MIVQYISRRNIFTQIKYGFLYNWYAATNPQTVEYGFLYNWYAATNANNIAASGWHISTDTEWNTLRTYIQSNGYSSGSDATPVKENSLSYWNSGLVADNYFKLNIRGSGYRDSGGFSSIKVNTYLWTSNSLDATRAYGRNIIGGTSPISSNLFDKYLGCSIRLVKDSTSLSNGQTGTYTGNDGRVYQTICIGTQEWLSENLMETKYRNGDAIPEVTDNAAWAALTTGARCAYNNTQTNVGVGSRITSSDDWVVPTQAQATTLQTYLGGGTDMGGKLKEIGLTHWDSPNTGATNETMFNSRGSGTRLSGLFGNIKKSHLIISSTENGTSYVYGINIIYNSSFGSISNGNLRQDGRSIRLLYTGAGTPTEYIGNDGKKYRVVTIGTQIWLADNLAETKYRDGSTIPEVTNDVTWAGLTSGALCAYNNDWNNV